MQACLPAGRRSKFVRCAALQRTLRGIISSNYMQKKIGWLVGLSTVLLLAGAGCTDTLPGEKEVTSGAYVPKTEEKGPIKIGWVGPLTGELAAPGQDAYKAAQLAADEVNSAGGGTAGK